MTILNTLTSSFAIALILVMLAGVVERRGAPCFPALAAAGLCPVLLLVGGFLLLAEQQNWNLFAMPARRRGIGYVLLICVWTLLISGALFGTRKLTDRSGKN